MLAAQLAEPRMNILPIEMQRVAIHRLPVQSALNNILWHFLRSPGDQSQMPLVRLQQSEVPLELAVAEVRVDLALDDEEPP
jgi:hypothetical protein